MELASAVGPAPLASFVVADTSAMEAKRSILSPFNCQDSNESMSMLEEPHEDASCALRVLRRSVGQTS